MPRLRWLAAPLVLCLASACSRGPAAPSEASRIDVLDFLLGTPTTWPREGSLSLNQTVDQARREVCWTKYGNPRTFECWRWDDSYIYHVVDHGIDGNTGESYTFADGRWLPRYFTGDWILDVSTRISWYDAACRPMPDRSGPFFYRQHAWIERARDAGGDLGVRDVLVLEYAPEDPAGGRTVPERFYFGRGAGWYEWSREAARRVFNRVGGPARPIARDLICS